MRLPNLVRSQQLSRIGSAHQCVQFGFTPQRPATDADAPLSQRLHSRGQQERHIVLAELSGRELFILFQKRAYKSARLSDDNGNEQESEYELFGRARKLFVKSSKTRTKRVTQETN